MTQDNPDQMQKLEVTRGVNLGAGAKVFMSEISNIFTKKEEEQKTRAQNVLEETNQIFYDLNQLHTASTYLQKAEPEHHKWSMLAAQMTQNNIIDKYNLSLEKTTSPPTYQKKKLIISSPIIEEILTNSTTFSFLVMTTSHSIQPLKKTLKPTFLSIIFVIPTKTTTIALKLFQKNVSTVTLV